MTNRIKYERGTKFNNTRLTFLDDIDSKNGRQALFICECGKTIKTKICNVKTLHTISCGCYKQEESLKRLTTHGLTNTPEYEAWCKLKQRTSNPNDPNYSRYGGRGITVCNEWSNSFEQFFKDMGPKPSVEHSIERKNNNDGYNSVNCCWAIQREQIRNRSNTILVTFNNITKPLIEWCEIYKLDYNLIYQRLRKGWDVNRAFNQR